jgi:hypothetical protein
MHPSTFDYLRPTDEQIARMTRVRAAAKAYSDVLEAESRRFVKPATTQAINIGPPSGTIRISQTILDRSSPPEPSVNAGKDL